jgi:hypothetical protein
MVPRARPAAATDKGRGQNRPAGGLRYPDFICIGAQKAGTTWLDRNLRQHPRLWLPPVKEMHYFNQLYLTESRKWTTRYRVERGNLLLRNYIAKTRMDKRDDRFTATLAELANGAVSDEWYGRVFALAPPRRICGEVTPDYSTLPEEGVRHIARLSPAVKIVFLLRDPIERSWSHIRMMTRTRRIADIAEIEQMARHPDQVRRADYSTIVANWLRIVPPERFLTILMDDVAEKPETALRELCAFLGIRYREECFAKAHKPVHVGEPRPMPPTVATILKERLRPAYDGIIARFPEIGTKWAARHY